MRTSRRARAGSSTGDLRMAPLIDAVFLMLTYFLFTISLSTIEGLLPSELAMGDSFDRSQIDPETTRREVIVRIVQTGARVQYFVDDWPTSSYDDVSRHLATLEANSTVVLDAGATVAYEHVVRVYNRCLQVGVDRVVFPLDSLSQASAPRS